MKKIYKKWMDDLVQLLYEANTEIKKALQNKRFEDTLQLFADCQEGAMKLGELIEKEEGEDCITISIIEEYCEFLYQCYDTLQKDPQQINSQVYRALQKLLIRIENSIKNDINIRLEVVFLPYKASMWDSLESIWMTAEEDPNCDAYVIPIPYYDRNPDGSFASYHYEGDSFPKEVPITHYTSYDLKENKPDIIYIHNPYDDGNYVTSVDPQYYSEELKKYTDLLVYVPYYVAGGGINEAQTKCLAYANVDYIIVQSKKYMEHFEKNVKKQKLLPLGSPKFDRVIRLCQNPPKVSEEWIQQMCGKTVYFYNTSINGMLKDTSQFLKKMRYVFQCFADNVDSCLLWRPHPLLESTFSSMRKTYYPEYLELKNMFIQQKLGIYDDTSDIENSIAYADVYIGDSFSSVVPLFGIAGKPLFVLDNQIDTTPDPNAWKEIMITGFYADNQMWLVTKNDKLYHKLLEDDCYHYVYDLSSNKIRDKYQKAIQIKDKVYVCPKRGQDILVFSKDKKEKRQIQLKPLLEKGLAFRLSIQIDQYIYLLPNQYPAIVRYDTETEIVDYITDCNDILMKPNRQEQRSNYAIAIFQKELFFAATDEDLVIALNYTNLETRKFHIGLSQKDNCFIMVPSEEDIWILPYTGKNITKWNPETGEITEYFDFPKDFVCYNPVDGQVCEEKPFRGAIEYKDSLILNPMWGNMFVSITATGQMEQFQMPDELWKVGEDGIFLIRNDQLGLWTYRFYNASNKRLFDYCLETGEVQEIEIKFDMEEVYKQESGFCKQSDRLQYACMESVFQTLPDFLANNIDKKYFDKAEQIAAFQKISANSNGTAGEVIHNTICEKLNKLRG